MIGTFEAKTMQLKTGTFKVGTGKEVIVIVGSCRAVPYIQYLKDWNELNGDRFTIHYIDPFNWNWDLHDRRTDYEAELKKQESNEYLINILQDCSIFIHEYYNNAGMFNCNRNAEKSIYQFGLIPKIDITLPNWNDIFILTSEICQFDNEVRKMAIQDYNVLGKLTEETNEKIKQVSEVNLQKFYNICSMTDFPEFAEIFKNHYKERRYFHTFNHVSKHFTQAIFRLMNSKFLKLNMEGYNITEEDLLSSHQTHLCEYDLGYTWPEQVKALREIL